MRDSAPTPRDLLAMPWPVFFDFLDTDYERAVRMFMDAGYRYLMARPPRQFFQCPDLDPGDFAIQVICALVENDCHRLRKYKNEGRPFIAWFRSVAVNRARDIMRESRARSARIAWSNTEDGEGDILDRIPAPALVENDRQLGDAILEEIESFGSSTCRKILWMRFVEDRSNQEISRRIPEKMTNAQVGNRFRDCRLALMRKLKKRGITPDRILEIGRRPGLGGS